MALITCCLRAQKFEVRKEHTDDFKRIYNMIVTDDTTDSEAEQCRATDAVSHGLQLPTLCTVPMLQL